MKNKNQIWFDEYTTNITSQTGEDGILKRIFEVLPTGDKWCCEFGAWDGKAYSNTYQLLKNGGWSGVLIEADSKKFEDLKKTYSGNPKVIGMNRFVEFEGENTLDTILAETEIPKDFDLLSIDIDGNDYHVWDSVKIYSPKVVVIEYNQSIANHIEYVQPADNRLNHGNSILSTTMLANSKGYELIAVTDLNGIYVRGDLYGEFGIADNSLQAMRPVAPYVTDLFQFYDGTIVTTGYNEMIWHNLPISKSKLQVVPFYIRSFPGLMGRFQSGLLKLVKSFRGNRE